MDARLRIGVARWSTAKGQAWAWASELIFESVSKLVFVTVLGIPGCGVMAALGSEGFACISVSGM